MNINKLLFASALLILTSCEFTEDFCIRPGELIAYCNWTKINEEPPIPESRHLIPFGTQNEDDIIFTQDTLRCSIPQGDYRFVFFTGNYTLENRHDFYEYKLSLQTDTIDGVAYLVDEPDYCCSAVFNEKLVYQQPKRVEMIPEPFVRRLNMKLNLSGNTKNISRVYTRIGGLSTSRYFYSKEVNGSAILSKDFKIYKTLDECYCSLYTLGFNTYSGVPVTIGVEMSDSYAAYNEEKSIDITSFIKDNLSDEISLEINLKIGEELEIETPVEIDEWDDIPEIVLPL